MFCGETAPASRGERASEITHMVEKMDRKGQNCRPLSRVCGSTGVSLHRRTWPSAPAPDPIFSAWVFSDLSVSKTEPLRFRWRRAGKAWSDEIIADLIGAFERSPKSLGGTE